MLAGEPIPKQTEWWPWQVQGLAVEPSAATEWLSRLPLSGNNPDLADELRWWSHLQRWALSLVARGRWIPQMELSKGEGYPCLLYTSPSPRDKRQSRMPSSA